MSPSAHSITRDAGHLSDFIAKLLAADGTPLANTVPGDPLDLDATTSERFNKGTVTGKVGIDFKTDNDDLIYASYSRGYRANAFNAQAFVSPDELDVAKPETVDAYEVGFKSQFSYRAHPAGMLGIRPGQGGGMIGAGLLAAQQDQIG